MGAGGGDAAGGATVAETNSRTSRAPRGRSAGFWLRSMNLNMSFWNRSQTVRSSAAVSQVVSPVISRCLSPLLRLKAPPPQPVLEPRKLVVEKDFGRGFRGEHAFDIRSVGRQVLHAGRQPPGPLPAGLVRNHLRVAVLTEDPEMVGAARHALAQHLSKKP